MELVKDGEREGGAGFLERCWEPSDAKELYRVPNGSATRAETNVHSVNSRRIDNNTWSDFGSESTWSTVMSQVDNEAYG